MIFSVDSIIKNKLLIRTNISLRSTVGCRLYIPINKFLPEYLPNIYADIRSHVTNRQYIFIDLFAQKRKSSLRYACMIAIGWGDSTRSSLWRRLGSIFPRPIRGTYYILSAVNAATSSSLDLFRLFFKLSIYYFYIFYNTGEPHLFIVTHYQRVLIIRDFLLNLL